MNPHQDIDALLAAEREVTPAPETLRRRVLLRVEHSVAQMAALKVQPPARRNATAGLRARRWSKLLVVPIGLGASWAFADTFLRRAVPEPAEQIIHPPQGESESTVAHAVHSTTGPAIVSQPITLPPSAVEPVNSHPSAPPLPKGSSALGPEAPTGDRYANELKMLQPAQRAVARSDFAAALVAINQHRRRFRNGVLAEEREALRVKALSGLGRTTEAQVAAESFRGNFPESALVDRTAPTSGRSK